jgi:hypothetical protein
MNALAFVHQNAQVTMKPRATGRGLRAKAHAAGVVAGLLGSVAVALSGTLLTLAGWLADDTGAQHWLSTAGSMLLFLTIPLLILGAFCLDWLEKDTSHRDSKAGRYDDDDDEQ